MAKKNELDLIPVRYIQTPYNFTKFSKNLSLLQQNVMVKVMDHLQKYLREYFETDLKDSKERPKPLFSVERKTAGIEPIKINYRDLGVEANNFPMCRKAIEEVMSIKIHEETVSETTHKPVIKYYNIFPEGEQDIGNDYAVFTLNSKWLDRIFDMQAGYVSHPVDIAAIGKVDKMPMIYYFLRHATRNWQELTAKVLLADIKEYLGMRVRDASGEIVEEKYQKYSQFKTYILDRAMKELDGLSKKGRVDITFTYKSLYRGGRKTGNPDMIEFTIKRTKAQVQPQAEQAVKPENVSSKVYETTEQKMARIWESLLLHLTSGIKQYLSPFEVKGFHGTELALHGEETDIKALEAYAPNHMDEYRAFLADANKHFGKKITGIGYV